MFSYRDKRSHLEFKVCLKQLGLSIKLRGKISRAWNSVIRILTAICTKHKYNMQARKLRNAYLVFLIIFLLQWQRALLLQQFYHFLVTEEEFRVRRRNRQMLLMFMAQMRQQNVRRRRRAWVWPRPQNWFKKLLASPALNFLWKEHFRVTRETFEYLCDLVRATCKSRTQDSESLLAWRKELA